MVNYFKELIHDNNHHQLALAVIFLIYIFINIKMPHIIAEGVSSMIGTVIIVIVALSLLLNSNPLVGILGIVVAYLLIERSNQQMKSKSSVATVMEKEMEKMKKANEKIKQNRNIKKNRENENKIQSKNCRTKSL